jgi:hypothetical protein
MWVYKELSGLVTVYLKIAHDDTPWADQAPEGFTACPP